MSETGILYLTGKDVFDTGVTLTEAVDVAEKVLIEHGKGNFQNPPKPYVYLPENNFLNAMPAYLPGLNVAGIKWTNVCATNTKLNLPSVMALVILNDVRTGQPVAIMDGAYITAQRTAAASAVAAKYLANQDAKVMGIVGTGTQARSHLKVLKGILTDIELVKAYDIDESTARKFIDSMRAQVSCKIEACSSIEAVIKESDIVVTATSNLSGKPPIFMGKWLQEGAFVLPVHNHGWEFSALEHADKFVVDDWKQYSANYHTDDYYPRLPPLYAELSEIVCGKKKGRETKREKIVSMHEGMALHDIALANRILAAAKEKGIGTMLPFLDQQHKTV